MPKDSQSVTHRKKKRHSAIYAPVVFVVICGAVIFAMSVFFRVSEIEVAGNSLYTAEEVMEAAGIEKGDNLFFINRFTAVSRIFSRLPYVENAYITRSLPNRITITVSESKAIAYIATDTKGWVVDRNCKILKGAESDDTVALIRINGISPINPSVGEVVAPGEEDQPKVTYLAEILDQIQQRGMEGDVTIIDMSSAADPSLDYLGRFTVKLGSREDTEYKFGMLLGAVAQLASGDTGTIDLSVDNKAHFSPQ